MCGMYPCLDEKWNILTRMFLQLHKKELVEVQMLAHEHEQVVKFYCWNVHEKVIANSICSSVKIFQYLHESIGGVC